MEWILIITLVFVVIYYYIVRKWNYFKRHRIPYVRGIPPFGVHYRRLLKLETWSETLKRIYDEHPNERFVGMYDIGGNASYLIRDPELIKDITIKNFDCFVNKVDSFNFDTDPLYARMLTYINGNAWRDIRSAVTPLFTSSKFRSVTLPAMIEAKKHFAKRLITELGNSKEKELDMMDFCNRTVIDSFGRSALGIETDAVSNEQSELHEEFKNMLGHMRSLNGFQVYAILHYPKIIKNIFGWTALNNSGERFFENMITDVAVQREKAHIDKLDILGMVVKAREIERNGKIERNTNSYPTELELTSQCLVFYLSVVTENNLLLNFIAQALADNSDIQNRLRNEMSNIRSALNGAELTLDTLRDMKYADMVISEALRMCSIAPQLKRRATKLYTLTNTDGTSIQVQPGDAIWMPIHIIQNDEQYYPNAKQFDPERFNDDNKRYNPSGIYAPFGLGPRDCIGCRYAIMEAKLTFFYLLENIELVRYGNMPATKHAIGLRKLI